MSSLICWNCGHDLSDEPLPISRHASCDKCAEVLHCCRFCEHFEPGRPGDCDNELADPPNEKASANFCEFFRPNVTAFGGAIGGAINANDQTRAKLNSLFGDDPDNIEEKSNPLDDLFSD